MKRIHCAILLSLVFATGALAQDGGNAARTPRCPPLGRAGRAAARECFELARRIRSTEDESERSALTAQLREKVAARHAARLEADKRRIEKAEREIAERHAAALRTLEAIKERVSEAEARQAENVDREVDALLAGREGRSPRGPGGAFGFGRRDRRPGADGGAAGSGSGD